VLQLRHYEQISTENWQFHSTWSVWSRMRAFNCYRNWWPWMA